MDVRIVEDLRNFLNDPPVAQDLAAINIQRGRDLGLGTLNETRDALGLKPYTDFDQITSDTAAVENLRKVYASVDQVDLWTGGLSESHAPGAAIGSTFAAILTLQFENLRDGDRHWFERQGFDAQTLNQIRQTRLSDIIERNTDTLNIQDDVFTFAERHSSEAAPEHPDAPQLVIGSGDGDMLAGGPLDDILVAGEGQQTMMGSAGRDRFVFSTEEQHATITDFQPGDDTLEFKQAEGMTYADVHIRFDQEGAEVLLAGSEVRLLGVRPSELGASDFLFLA